MTGSAALFLRSLVFHIIFYMTTIALIIIGLPRFFMGRRDVQHLGQTWGRATLWLLDKIVGLKIEWRGVENIPQGAVIVAAKHQSIWDTFVIPIRFYDFSYILKRELIWIPFFGWYLLAAGQIAIDRAKGAKLMRQLIEKARAIFADGRQLFIFPEGTRRPVGATPAYKSGVAQLYAETGVPVLPVALNAGLFWPKRAFIIRPGTAIIEFLPVIPPGMKPKDFFRLLTEQIETASNKLIDEAVAKDSALAAIVEKNKNLPSGEKGATPSVEG